MIWVPYDIRDAMVDFVNYWSQKIVIFAARDNKLAQAREFRKQRRRAAKAMCKEKVGLIVEATG